MSPLLPLLALIGFLASTQTTADATDAADVEARRQQGLEAAEKLIAGREKEPAETVFKDIQIFKGMPAERVLRIMDKGWSRSLGVACDHCHVQTGWEKNDKAQKQIAREMTRMTRAINEEQLKKIFPNPPEPVAVNCTTCHRGQIKPALDLK